MDTRKIGTLDVSVVGLGCNNFGMRLDQQQTTAVIDACFEAGITYFDTADSYGDTQSEVMLGVALGSRRDEVVVATKFGSSGSPDGTLTGGHPDWVRQAAEASLTRLGTDRIDHYQFHRPDPEVPLSETMGALNELVVEGKVIEVGCSNFDVSQLDQAASIASAEGWAAFTSVQNRYSALHREPEEGVIDACRRFGVALVPYFPLESGLLTGKVSADGEAPEGTRLAAMPEDRRGRFLNPDRLVAVDRLRSYAADHEKTLLELAFGYLLATDVVASVIAGATRPEQVAANAAAAGWILTEDQRQEVAALAG